MIVLCSANYAEEVLRIDGQPDADNRWRVQRLSGQFWFRGFFDGSPGDPVQRQ